MTAESTSFPLDWETRAGYEKPGAICMVEYDPEKKEIIGYPKRIWKGGTDRGCIEAPHLTKRNGYYYIMCAEGGTGYNHCVTMGRSENVWGPYVGDPKNPIVTSNPAVSNERHDPITSSPSITTRMWCCKRLATAAMWKLPWVRYIWCISAPVPLHRSCAAHWAEKQRSRK